MRVVTETDFPSARSRDRSVDRPGAVGSIEERLATPLVGQSGRGPRYGVVGAPRDRCGRQAPRHGNPVGGGCRHAGALGAGLVPPPVGRSPERPGPLRLEWPFTGAYLALAARRDSAGGFALDVSEGASGATSRQTAGPGGRRDARRGRFHEGEWSRHSDLNRGPAVYECGRSLSFGGSCGLPRQAGRTSNPLCARCCHQGTGPQGSARGSGDA